MEKLRILLFVLLSTALVACRHPLAIEGQGDIIETVNGLRGCALEEFEAGLQRCTDNEVFTDETAIYRALPRAGWRFSHWDGACREDSTDGDCKLTYSSRGVDFWEQRFPDEPGPTLTAVFVEDSTSAGGSTFLASSFGVADERSYSSQLEALLTTAGGYRYLNLQASTREFFNRDQRYYQRLADGLLGIGPAPGSLGIGGTALASLGFLAVVDTDNSDGDVSVTYLLAKQTKAANSSFLGTYYCGRIGSNGDASFARVVMDGAGRGIWRLESDRRGASGQTAVSFQVAEDGTTTLNYPGLQLLGTLTPDGNLFVGTQLQSAAQGAAICLRASAEQTLFTAQGLYYGAWSSTQPAMGVTEFLVDDTGQTLEAVLLDSFGGRDYTLGADWMLVNFDGRLSTSTADGAISADGRVMFILDSNPSKFPTLKVYIRQT